MKHGATRALSSGDPCCYKRRMSANHSTERKQAIFAVGTAVAILVALAAAIAGFAVTGPPRDRLEGAPGGPAALGVAPPRVASRGEFVRGAGNPGGPNPRQTYASSINRRLRSRGRTCTISATGEMGRDLTISWTRKDFDREGKGHFEQLKTATGFFEGLRALRFARLVMKVDGTVLFTKVL